MEVLIAASSRALPFDDICTIRKEALRAQGAKFLPKAEPEEQLAQAWEEEQEDLRRAFRENRGTKYFFAGNEGRWQAMCRLEPYQDGFLLSSLETAPDSRRQGFAGFLVKAVQSQIAGSGKPLYSHAAKSNGPSLRLHENCGFQKTLDHAHLLDGSTTCRYCTLTWENPEK